MVQDGEIPELYVGSTLRDHAVRASCWSIRASRSPEGFTELSGPDPWGDRAPHYQLTGTVEGGEEPGSVLVRVGGFRVLAEPIHIRQVPGTSLTTCALERFSPDFFVPAVGTRVSLNCRLEVMAEYEAEDTFGSGHLRRDWVVRHLKLQHRAPAPQRAGALGKVLRVDEIERMHRWTDEQDRDHVTYLLDLETFELTAHCS
jgi:hypothetical protein